MQKDDAAQEAAEVSWWCWVATACQGGAVACMFRHERCVMSSALLSCCVRLPPRLLLQVRRQMEEDVDREVEELKER